MKRDGRIYTKPGTVMTGFYTDAVPAGKAYLYKVQARSINTTANLAGTFINTSDIVEIQERAR